MRRVCMSTTTTRARRQHGGGARVILERAKKVLQPQVADVVVVEVERGQRLVLLERRAQELCALGDTAEIRRWRWGGLECPEARLTSYCLPRTTCRVLLKARCLLTAYYGARRGGSCCR